MVKSRSMRNDDHRFQELAAERPAAERQAVAGELLGNAARAFFGRAGHDVLNQGAGDAAPIDSAMIEEPGVFAGEQGVDEKRRDLVQRHHHPIRAREPAVDFAVDVENRIPLRHFADVFQIERLRPGRVEQEDAKNRRRWAA